MFLFASSISFFASFQVQSLVEGISQGPQKNRRRWGPKHDFFEVLIPLEKWFLSLSNVDLPSCA